MEGKESIFFHSLKDYFKAVFESRCSGCQMFNFFKFQNGDGLSMKSDVFEKKFAVNKKKGYKVIEF